MVFFEMMNLFANCWKRRPKRFHATSKSDDESSASLYEYIRFECPRAAFVMMLLLAPVPAVKPLNDDVDSFKLHFNEPLFK